MTKGHQETFGVMEMFIIDCGDSLMAIDIC